MRVRIDVSGAIQGGAARYLDELDTFLQGGSWNHIRIHGRGRRLNPTWLVRREFPPSMDEHRVALNNVSYIGGATRTVLLGNALHFAEPEYVEYLGLRYSRELHWQTRVVRSATLRADRIVVPSSDMANRVGHYLPQTRARIDVRFHPVSTSRKSESRNGSTTILVPIVNTPYKRLEDHLEDLRVAMDRIGFDGLVVATSRASDVPAELARDHRFQFVGVLSKKDLDSYWETCSMVFFPTKLESFGFALAEARCMGLPVVAADSPHNREIADQALVPYALGDRTSLAEAITTATHFKPDPDPEPFDRTSYFRDLLGLKDA